MPGYSRAFIAMLTLAGTAGVGGTALAQTTPPPAPKVFHACYVPLTGTVYRVGETGIHATCTSDTHVPFSWTDGDGAVRVTDAAGGDLGGTFGAALVVGLQGHAVSNTAPTTGQVLTFDGTKWGPAAMTGVATDGSFLATGAFDAGTVPATGPGVRLMWYPAKAAIRAGLVTGSQWDDAYIGTRSIALGVSNTASGNASTALGSFTIASGQLSTALGYLSTASGDGSTAIGSQSVASGLVSIAMGNDAQALGSNSVAIGFQTTAMGSASTAMGATTGADGNFSTALGFRTTASGDETTALGNYASTNGQQGAFVYGDYSTSSIIRATAPNQFVVRAQQIWFGTNSTVNPPANTYIGTSTGAYLSTGGVWTNVSDVNRKHLFTEISSDEVLDRLATMPVREWSYKAEADSIRHIGPTAQDFYAAFHLGSSDTSIPTIDADGVSLAAIKALAKRTQELQAENTDLTRRLVALESQMRELRRRSRERP